MYVCVNRSSMREPLDVKARMKAERFVIVPLRNKAPGWSQIILKSPNSVFFKPKTPICACTAKEFPLLNVKSLIELMEIYPQICGHILGSTHKSNPFNFLLTHTFYTPSKLELKMSK